MRVASGPASAGGDVRPRRLPIDPRIRERRIEVQRARGRRRLRALVGFAGVLSAIAAALVALHSSLLGARSLRVEGAEGQRAEAVLRAARLQRGEPLVDIAPAAAAARVERLAWVATASVHRSWPWTVEVRVRVRSAVAQVPRRAGALRGPVALVDLTGRVLTTAASPRPDLPVLRGVGAPPERGRWLAGSPGAGQPLGTPPTEPTAVARALRSARGGVSAALAVAGALRAAHIDADQVTISRGAALTVTVGRPPASVELGHATALLAKVDALRALAAAGALTPGATVELAVPDRPAVSPAGP